MLSEILFTYKSQCIFSSSYIRLNHLYLETIGTCLKDAKQAGRKHPTFNFFSLLGVVHKLHKNAGTEEGH